MDKKHPCPDCQVCQWCSDERCRLCLKSTSGCRKHLSLTEQIARYEALNRQEKEQSDPNDNGPT